MARYLQAEGLARTLPLKVPIDLPPVGLIVLRGRARTTATTQLIEALRAAARR